MPPVAGGAELEVTGPVLEVVVGAGEPWDHPDYRGRRTKLIGVHNPGSLTAFACRAQIVGLGPLPQTASWLTNGGKSTCDILADDTAYVAIQFSEDGFKSGVGVRVWVGDSSLPISALFDVTVSTGMPFPWFNRRMKGTETELSLAGGVTFPSIPGLSAFDAYRQAVMPTKMLVMVLEAALAEGKGFLAAIDDSVDYLGLTRDVAAWYRKVSELLAWYPVHRDRFVEQRASLGPYGPFLGLGAVKPGELRTSLSDRVQVLKEAIDDLTDRDADATK